MKFNLMAIALLSSVTLLGKSASAFQLTPPPEPLDRHTISQAPAPLNLSLLAQTVTNLLKSDRSQTDSQTEFRVKSQGTEATIYLQSKVITQTGKKFRAEITYNSPGKPPQTGNLVVSDGQQVWTYRPDLKQYAVTSYQNFRDSSEWILIGLSSFMLMDFPEEERKFAASGNLSDQNISSYLNLTGNKDFKGNPGTVDGQPVYIYSYKDPKDGFTLSGFVNPETATLKQLQVAGKTDGLDILMTEKIISQTSNPTIDTNTFQFSPPQGTRKVRTLSISPL